MQSYSDIRFAQGTSQTILAAQNAVHGISIDTSNLIHDLLDAMLELDGPDFLSAGT